MNITEHRKEHFHLDGIESTKKEVTKGQQTVEEFIANGGIVQKCAQKESNFESDLKKANKQVAINKAKRVKAGVTFRGNNK